MNADEMSMTHYTRSEMARLIDHTLLAPEVSAAEVGAAATFARDHGCATLCIRPRWIPTALPLLTGSATTICTVVNFPDGSEPDVVVAEEAERAMAAGAAEIDTVIPWRHLDRPEQVRRHLLAVRFAAPDVVLKVILESAALTDEEIETACILAYRAGADYVKTSTGYHPAGGATEAAVRLMAATVPDLGVKASGGIKTLPQALCLLEAGATRIGTSVTATLLASLDD